MPLTRKGEKILHAMQSQYGGKKGKSVFYASSNKGKIKGVHRTHPDSSHHSPPTRAMLDAHKALREEVAGGLRNFVFDRFRDDQQTPPYRE
jgi:hypothetical protein